MDKEREEKESELWTMKNCPTENWHRYLILIGSETFVVLFPTWGSLRRFVAESG
jgi:hypothetical protein